jgi:WD40 repeat protein
MQCVSDITAHSGYIKCLKVWENHSYLLTAADKTVMIWDLISLTNVFTFKYHKDEIRAVDVSACGNYMISAGKGSASQGAMSIWDLRS